MLMVTFLIPDHAGRPMTTMASSHSLPLRLHLHLHRPSSQAPPSSSSSLPFPSPLKFTRYGYGACLRGSCRNSFRIPAMDEDSIDFGSFDGFDDHGIGSGVFLISSASEGDESDAELLVIPPVDTSLDSTRLDSSNVDLSATAHGIASIQRKRRIRQGIFINIGLLFSLSLLLLLVDYCSWKVVRLPFPEFQLTRPFFIAAVLVSVIGFICIPLLNYLKIHQILRKKGPLWHSSKKGTPTMGGIFFIPIGIAVAIAISGKSSTVVCGAACATLAYCAIGFLDDILSLLKNHNSGLQPWLKLLMQVTVGIFFILWLNGADISSPYNMKLLIPLPPPLGLLDVGNFYFVITTFCFVAMGNGVNLTDGLDGLAGGAAAFALVAMSIVVLPICSDLAVFGASMAGACVGFLLHNRYKASVFMGDTGSLALGGALAAMAACTGMFFPLFIASGVFVLESLSVVVQVCVFKVTKQIHGRGTRLFRMAPLHHHLELCGIKEPVIVANAYLVSYILTLLAGYVGLISA